MSCICKTLGFLVFQGAKGKEGFHLETVPK